MDPLLDVVQRSTRLSERTKEAYERCVRRFLNYAGADPRNWNGMVVENWRDELAQQVSARTVNKHLYALRYATGRLQALGLGDDFARPAETIPAPTVKRMAMSQDEVRALMETCRAERPADLRDRALMTLALTTALRSENVQMVWFEHIEGRRMKVLQKGRRYHAPVLDDRSLHRLGQWADWLQQAGIAVRGPVFRSIRQQQEDGRYIVGAPISQSKWFNRMLDKRRRAAGITRSIYPHLFRHTAISWLLEAGVSPARVMGQTGQKSMATLSQYVTDLQAEEDPIGSYLPEF